MNTKKSIYALLAIVVFALLLTGAYFLAGMILFLSFHENPLRADWYTIFDAWNTLTPGTVAATKLRGSIIIASILVLGVPLGLFLSMRKKNIDLHGKARFANDKDIESQGFTKPIGVLIGKLKDQLLRFPGYEFVLLAAPTRSGKGVSFVIPNLLTFPDSVVVLDIKGENYNLTSEFRRKYLGQQIFYFNPFSENSHRWNPLSYISKDPNFRANDLLALATIIYPPDPKTPFWSDSSRNLFMGLGLMVLETPHLPQTIGEILRQASGKGLPVQDYLASVLAKRAETDTPFSNACLDSLNRFLNNSEDTLKNILSSFVAPLALWTNPVVDKATCADDFDLREVRKKKMTVYIHIAASDVQQASFIINLFFSQLINENVKELPEQNQELKYQCLLLLDEFTSIGKVAIIAKGVGFMAGYNMRLLIIIQDRAQIEAVYGKEDAHNIFGNMGAVIYFTPTQVKEANEYSEMIGYDTVVTRSAQHSNIGALNVGKYSLSETESQQKRALMLPQELLRMPQTKSLIARPGIPIIMSEKIRYYEDPYFKDRFFAVPLQEVKVGQDVRKVPIPIETPLPKWRFYWSTVSRSEYYIDGDFSDLMEQEIDLMELVEKEKTPQNFDNEKKRLANLEIMAAAVFKKMQDAAVISE